MTQNRKKVTVYLTPETVEKIKREAKANSLSLSAYIERTLNEKIDLKKRLFSIENLIKNLSEIEENSLEITGEILAHLEKSKRIQDSVFPRIYNVLFLLNFVWAGKERKITDKEAEFVKKKAVEAYRKILEELGKN